MSIVQIVYTAALFYHGKLQYKIRKEGCCCLGLLSQVSEEHQYHWVPNSDVFGCCPEGKLVNRNQIESYYISTSYQVPEEGNTTAVRILLNILQNGQTTVVKFQNVSTRNETIPISLFISSLSQLLEHTQGTFLNYVDKRGWVGSSSNVNFT